MFRNKTIKRVAIILVWVLVAAMVISTFAYIAIAEEAAPAGTAASIEQQLSDMEEVLKEIEANYVDDVDLSLLVDGAYQGLFEQLDPYSTYFSTQDQGDEFMSWASGEYYGIGVVFTRDDDGVFIKEFTDGSAAEAAGMKAGDRILSVDGVSMEGKSTSEVAAAVRGENATSVRVVALRGGRQLTFTLTRALMHTRSVTCEMKDDTTAYMQISNFYSSTTSEFARTWASVTEEHPDVSGLVIDLRDNPGGLVASAITLANLFLDRDDIIMHYEKRGEVVYEYLASGARMVDVPVVLLVNDETASSAEIFAGALQDNGEAVLIGATTFGKGVAQTVHPLESGAYLKLSVYYFTTPARNQIHGIGLTPDITVYNGDNKTAQQRYLDMKTVAAMDEGKKYTFGERGLNVYAAQQRLSILGFDQVKLNATLDDATKDALKKIQKEAGVYVYGALDFTTIRCLEEIYNQNLYGVEEDLQLERAIKFLK